MLAAWRMFSMSVLRVFPISKENLLTNTGHLFLSRILLSFIVVFILLWCRREMYMVCKSARMFKRRLHKWIEMCWTYVQLQHVWNMLELCRIHSAKMRLVRLVRREFFDDIQRSVWIYSILQGPCGSSLWRAWFQLLN